jgi:hypothetical protein
VAGGLILIALLFMPWYEYDTRIPGQSSSFATAFEEITMSGDAWGSQGILGTLANLVILGAALGALALAAVTVLRDMTLPPQAWKILVGLGVAATAMVVARMVFDPGGGALDVESGARAFDEGSSEQERIDGLGESGVSVTFEATEGLDPAVGIWVALVAALALAASGLVARRLAAPRPPSPAG